jgi:hypothetical protein
MLCAQHSLTARDVSSSILERIAYQSAAIAQQSKVLLLDSNSLSLRCATA